MMGLAGITVSLQAAARHICATPSATGTGAATPLAIDAELGVREVPIFDNFIKGQQ
jgi:hypothetical protein